MPDDGAQGSPADEIVDGGGADLLAAGDPVAAETWASGLIEVFEAARLEARLDGRQVPPFEDAVVETCRRRGDDKGLVVASALACVLPPAQGAGARQATAALAARLDGPAWVGAIGEAEAVRAWLACDVFGDQDSLIIEFAHRHVPRPPHALVVLVDHNLSGQAKDAWITDEVEGAVDAWRTSAGAHVVIGELAVEEALARLRDAMAASDLWNGDTALRSDDFARHRALIWARLRRAGLGEGPAAVEVGDDDRKAIVADFMASAPGRAVTEALEGVDVELLAYHLVDLRSDYEGRPLRWSPAVVQIVLADLVPRKLILDDDEAAALPAVLTAFVRFCAGRTGLADHLVAEIVEAVARTEATFRERFADPSAAGPAKAVLAALEARGIDLSDFEAMNAALADLGPLPLAPARPARARERGAAPAEAVEQASASVGLARLGTLCDFYGDGRKLTQTGQPTLADARALVGLLGTDDRLDEKIGDRVFRTTSAADLPELSFTVRWAIAAGALRKEHGKLRATANWRKLATKPMERWVKAADAVVSLGPLDAYFAKARYRGGTEIVDEFLTDILAALGRRPMPYDDVLDLVCARADREYQWLAPYMQDPEHRRTSFTSDLDLVVRILGWAGVVDRVGATTTPARWAHRRDTLVGGTLQLTPAGRWWQSAR